MNKYILKLSFASLILFSFSLLADDGCKGTEADVSGYVNTTNIYNDGIPTGMQAGEVHLILTSKDGNNGDLLDKIGGVVGRITSQDNFGRPATLNHNMIFEDGVVIETTGDEVKEFAPTYPFDSCSFNMVEEITNIWGTKEFKNASGTITATGTINLCGESNQFILTGTVCLKSKD